MKEEQIDIKSFEKLPKFIAVEGPIGAGKQHSVGFWQILLDTIHSLKAL